MKCMQYALFHSDTDMYVLFQSDTEMYSLFVTEACGGRQYYEPAGQWHLGA